jgi:phosphate:Na+ symporter
VRKIEHFLETLSLETLDRGALEPRLVRICHAIDHLKQLHEDLTKIPPPLAALPSPASFGAAARALEAWLETQKVAPTAFDPAILDAIESASVQTAAENRAGREKILEDIALQRTPASTAEKMLETLSWADSATYHAWRMAKSLSIASAV